jgi:cytochrome d ubiquinol oxidase subunit II
METTWFVLLSFLLAGYVLLDGYDLGVGAVHLCVAKNEHQRRQTIASIAPFWDANEVWLLAAGGTLFFAFPSAYAAAFSGFYLPLMIVLWLLILRGLAIDLRNHSTSPVWVPVWDFGFCFSSTLLALFLGVALGNVIRGLPIDTKGEFFLPLWTDFRVSGAEAGVLDWYTVLTGLFSTAALCMHGSLWLQFKVEGAVRNRARTSAGWLQGVTVILGIVVSIATFRIQPQALPNLERFPVGFVFPLVAAGALIGCMIMSRRERTFLAFVFSSVFLVAILAAAALTVYPYVLPATPGSQNGISIYNSNPGPYGMRIGLLWWLPGMALAVAYSVFSHWHFSGKVPE